METKDSDGPKTSAVGKTPPPYRFVPPPWHPPGPHHLRREPPGGKYHRNSPPGFSTRPTSSNTLEGAREVFDGHDVHHDVEGPVGKGEGGSAVQVPDHPVRQSGVGPGFLLVHAQPRHLREAPSRRKVGIHRGHQVQNRRVSFDDEPGRQTFHGVQGGAIQVRNETGFRIRRGRRRPHPRGGMHPPAGGDDVRIWGRCDLSRYRSWLGALPVGFVSRAKAPIHRLYARGPAFPHPPSGQAGACGGSLQRFRAWPHLHLRAVVPSRAFSEVRMVCSSCSTFP